MAKLITDIETVEDAKNKKLKEKSSIDCYDVYYRINFNDHVNSNMIFVKMLACNLRHTVLLQINVLVDSGRP